LAELTSVGSFPSMSIAMFGYWRNRQEHSTYCWSIRQFVGCIPNWYRRFLDHITMEKPHPKTLPEWLFWWRPKHFKMPVNCTWTFQKTMKCKSMKIPRNFDIRVCLKIRYPKSHLNNAIVHIPFISGQIHSQEDANILMRPKPWPAQHDLRSSQSNINQFDFHHQKLECQQQTWSIILDWEQKHLKSWRELVHFGHNYLITFNNIINNCNNSH